MSELLKFKCTVNAIGNIELVNDFDRVQLLNCYKIGQHFQCELKQKRSYKSLGLYWLICNGLAFQSGGTAELFHNHFKMMFLPSKEILNPLTNCTERCLSSTAFDKMNEIEYKQYLSAVIEYLVSKSIDYNDLIVNTENRVN